MNRAERRRQQKNKKDQKTQPSSMSTALSLKLAGEHHSAGRLVEAERIYRQVLKSEPDNADAHHRIGVLAHQLGHIKLAIEHISKAVLVRPDFWVAFGDLGNAQMAHGNPSAALISYRKVIDIKPEYAEIHSDIGNALNELGLYAEAIENYQKTIMLKPSFAKAYLNLGHAFGELGRKEDALKAYERALEIKPNYAECYRSLSALKTFTEDDPHFGIMQLLLESNTLDDSERGHLEFALAKAFDDINRFDQSFGHLAKGNQLFKKVQGYSREHDEQLFRHLKDRFETYQLPSQIKQSPPQNDTRSIFILGMPRSGTSLTEQIIASHSLVHGAGELQAMRRCIAPHLLSGDIDAAAKSIRKNYFNALAQEQTQKHIITDKMPSNFMWLGFILASIPDAKIIHVRRDARAVCWSIFKNYLSAQALGFSFNLDDIVRFYHLYDDLMDFWAQKFPGQIYELNYETLTQNQEEETRKLLAFSGLAWEEQCLSFHKTERVVKTASSSQVRERLYTGSSEAWRHYEKHLKDVFDTLAKGE